MAMKFTPTLTFTDAKAALGAALADAEARGVRVSVAVVDAAAALLMFARMDGARGHTVELAQQKARTAASVGVATSLIAKAQPTATSAGGVPVLADGECAGAVGVSGASIDVDEAIALAACAAAEKTPLP
jgi:glc operon protein GlcG